MQLKAAAMEIVDCYRVLGLRMGASCVDVKASYRRLARLYHPDSNPANQQQAKEKFIQITNAYRHLLGVVQAVESNNPPTVHLKQDRQRVSRAAASPMQHRSRATTPLSNSEVSTIDRKLKQSTYDQLQQFLKEQRYPRAIALIEGLAQRLPNDVEVRQWQAITYQRFGRYLISQHQPGKASVYLKKALRTDPHNKSLWVEVDRQFRRIEQSELF